MKIYIAGPMSGLERNNYPAFHDAASVLEAAGYQPISPARGGLSSKAGRAEYMRRGLRDVLEADGVAVLAGCKRPRGAQLEVRVAEALSLDVRPISDWVSAAGREKASISTTPTELTK
jgi:hypothetical protein